MQSVFESPAREEIRVRIDRLQPASARQWGKMTPAQMLTHCALTVEMATGDLPGKQKLIGKILMPFIKKSLLGEKPFGKNSPTDPKFVVSDERDFAKEKARLAGALEKLCRQGPDFAAGQEHSFFGRLSGEEWGRLVYKHLDHHLRQFGA